MNLLLANEFNAGLSSCQGDASANCKSVLSQNDVDISLVWFYVLMIFILFAVFRLIGALVLVQRAKRFY